MSESNKSSSKLNRGLLLFDEAAGVVSLYEDHELDTVRTFHLKWINNMNLQVKYPNVGKIKEYYTKNKSPSLKQHKELEKLSRCLKTVFLNVKAFSEYRSKDANATFCELMLGIYVNLAYEPNAKSSHVVIQGFAPKKVVFRNDRPQIGKKKIPKNFFYVSSLFFCFKNFQKC
jgi:hypothetical protein